MSTLGLAILGIAGPWEWVVILVIVLILFGPGKLPSIGKALGEGLRSFKKATSSDDEIDVTPRSPSQIEGHKPTVDSASHAESHSKV